MKLIAALSVGALVCLCRPMHAQVEDNLKGVSEITIVMSVDKSLKDAGVSEDDIRTSTEVKLRNTGWKVLPVSGPGSIPKTSNFVTLEVSAQGIKFNKMPVYCYVVGYTVVGNAQQVEPPHKLLYVTIWQLDRLGYVAEEKISVVKDAADALCDSLANDYLKANPKPSPVAP